MFVSCPLLNLDHQLEVEGVEQQVEQVEVEFQVVVEIQVVQLVEEVEEVEVEEVVELEVVVKEVVVAVMEGFLRT